MEVHGLRRVDDGEVRRHGGEARGVPRVAPLEGLAGRDAGRRAVLQAQDGRVLGGLAHARPRRRAPPRALRRRDLGRARPRRAHMLQRREGGLLVHGEVGELEAWSALMAPIPAPRWSSPTAGAGSPRPCARPGRAPGSRGAPSTPSRRSSATRRRGRSSRRGASSTSSRATSWASRRCTGRSSGRALPRLVRVLGRLPGGQDRGGRQEGLHPREAEAARSSLSSLVSAGTLFTYLDPALAKPARCRRPTT